MFEICALPGSKYSPPMLALATCTLSPTAKLILLPPTCLFKILGSVTVRVVKEKNGDVSGKEGKREGKGGKERGKRGERKEERN